MKLRFSMSDEAPTADGKDALSPVADDPAVVEARSAIVQAAQIRDQTTATYQRLLAIASSAAEDPVERMRAKRQLPAAEDAYEMAVIALKDAVTALERAEAQARRARAPVWEARIRERLRDLWNTLDQAAEQNTALRDEIAAANTTLGRTLFQPADLMWPELLRDGTNPTSLLEHRRAMLQRWLD